MSSLFKYTCKSLMNTDAIQQALHDSAGVVKLSTHVQRSAL